VNPVPEMAYTVEVVWNRESVFVPIGSSRTPDLDVAIVRAKELENMGDGERVKKARVVDQDGVVVWQQSLWLIQRGNYVMVSPEP
jgi:predicted membrane GTPase involved in stress response